MKNILLLMMIVPFITSAQFKENGIEWSGSVDNMVVSYSNNIKYQGDSISFIITPSTNRCWELEVINESKSKVVIDWENAKLAENKMFFGDMLRFQMNQPIPSETLYAGGNTKKEIIDANGAKYGSLPIEKWELKKMYKKSKTKSEITVQIIVPLKTGNADKVFMLNITGGYEK